jgi:hypothetical protein
VTPPLLPASLIATYESLRADVLRGQARPEGLGAIIFHGLIEGLTLLCSSSTRDPTPARASTVQPIARDHELLRLLANMVLQTQSEVKHVY